MKKNIIILFSILLFISGCFKKVEEKEQKTKKKLPVVMVQTIKPEEFIQTIETPGKVVSTNSVIISSTLDGPIKFCPWREGDFVQKGQRIIEIDRDVYQEEVKVAEKELNVALAKLEDMKAGTRPEEIAKAKENIKELSEKLKFAKNDLDRITKLVQNGALPGEQLEKAQVEYVSIQSKLESAKAQLEILEKGYTPTEVAVQEAVVKSASAKLSLAKAKLAECIIKAPFSGVITKVYVREGDLAVMKMPLIEMMDTSSLVIRTSISESFATKVKTGMLAKIVLDAYPGQIFTGKVSRVYPEMDEKLHTRTIEISLIDKTKLLPGMFARIEIIIQAIKNALIIPEETILTDEKGEKFVFIVEGNKAIQKKIKTGFENKGKVQVIEGIKEGDKLIIAGYERLKSGQEVQIIKPGISGSAKSNKNIEGNDNK